jgi:hypothetical protein
MKSALSGLAVMVLAAFTIQPTQAQTMSPEEESVHNTYAKLALLSGHVSLTRMVILPKQNKETRCPE